MSEKRYAYPYVKRACNMSVPCNTCKDFHPEEHEHFWEVIFPINFKNPRWQCKCGKTKRGRIPILSLPKEIFE